MKKFFKETKAGRFIVGFLRGAIRSVPAGNALIDGIENMSKKHSEDFKPHRWTSIISEIVFISIVLYAFATKLITVEDVLRNIAPFIQQTQDLITQQ